MRTCERRNVSNDIMYGQAKSSAAEPEAMQVLANYLCIGNIENSILNLSPENSPARIVWVRYRVFHKGHRIRQMQ